MAKDKEAKTKLYRVEIGKFFTQPTRWRAGRQFERNVAQFLDLTEAEAKEFKNDRYMEIKPATAKDKETYLAKQAERASAQARREEATKSQIKASEDKATKSEEADTGSDEEEVSELDKLLRDNTRPQLDDLAREKGIENPQDLASKAEVANAILGNATETPTEEDTTTGEAEGETAGDEADKEDKTEDEDQKPSEG